MLCTVHKRPPGANCAPVGERIRPLCAERSVRSIVCRDPKGASEGSIARSMEDAEVPALSPRQVELIEETWKLVAADLQGAGTVMFMK